MRQLSRLMVFVIPTCLAVVHTCIVNGIYQLVQSLERELQEVLKLALSVAPQCFTENLDHTADAQS